MNRPKSVYVAGVLAFCVAVYVFGDDERLLAALQPAILGFPFLYDLMTREERAPRIVSVREFGWRWRRLVLCGTLMIFLSFQLVDVVSSLLIAAMSASPEFVIMHLVGEISPLENVGMLVMLAWGPPAFFLSGRWMGQRAPVAAGPRQGMASVVSSCLLGMLVSAGVTAAVGAVLGEGTLQDSLRAEDRQLLQGWSQVPDLGGFLVDGLALVFLVAAPALLGYWRGRREAPGAYLGYLLGKIPATVRETIVQLAHDEAVGTSSRRGEQATRVVAEEE